MLCPRCNSENELGEKFCRHCGAPLTDTELFLSDKEKKNIKKQRKIQEKQERIARQNRYQQTQRTYSLLDQSNSKKQISILLSLLKSIIILIGLLVLIIFITGFVLTAMYKKSDHYSVDSNNIPSVNYVLGDRNLTKVSYSFKNSTFKTIFTFEKIADPSNDVTKYVAYLMENNEYQLIGTFDPSFEQGTVKLGAKSKTTFEDTVIVEINWQKAGYTIETYHVKTDTLNKNASQ